MNNPATIYRTFWPVTDELSVLSRPDAHDHTAKKIGLNIVEKRNRIQVTADMPCIPKDNIKVHYHDGTLWMRGSAECKDEDKTKDFYHESYRTFTYRLRLPNRAIQNKKPNVTYHKTSVVLKFDKVAVDKVGSEVPLFTPQPFTEW